MLRNPRRLIALCAACCILSIAIGAQAGELTCKFKPGHKISYVQTMDLQMSLNMFGSSLGEAQTKRTIAFDREVLKNDQQNRRRLQITVRAVQLEENSPGETPKSFDSTKKTAPAAPEQQLYAALINKPVVIVLNDNNGVAQINGRDEIVAAAQSALNDSEQKDAVAGEFDSLFSDTTDIGSLVTIRDLDPNKKVNVNDTWEKVWGGDLVDAEKMPALITLKSIAGDVYTLDYAVKTEELKQSLEKPASPEDPPTKVDRIKVEGTILFDIKNGVITRSDDLIDMAMSMGEGDQSMMSMTITAKIHLESK